MTFDDVLGQVKELPQQQKRVSYRGLKRRFDWFTEGFDTKDLQEAQALLQALHD
jgi:hypothetical protein